MKTENITYLSRLDHLRFLAIILVILTHFKGHIEMPQGISNLADFANTWIVGGSTGVTLFLVLSGFLFCLITNICKNEINYKLFIKNRILRIFPLLVFLFFITICVGRKDSTPMDVLRLLTLQLNTGNAVTGWGNNIFPVGPIWTIAVEFQFYLIFPFLAYMVNKNGISHLYGIILILIITRLIICILENDMMYYNFYHTIIGRLDQFLVGMIFANIYDRFSTVIGRKIYSLPLLIISTTLLTLYINGFSRNHFNNSFGFTYEAILWSAILMSYLSMRINIPKKIDKALAFLGTLSFSMYLLHLPIGSAIRTHIAPSLFGGNMAYTAILIILPATTVFSLLTYTFIEKPFLSMRTKYLSN